MLQFQAPEEKLADGILLFETWESSEITASGRLERRRSGFTPNIMEENTNPHASHNICV